MAFDRHVKALDLLKIHNTLELDVGWARMEAQG
jgi:hypothetical protein